MRLAMYNVVIILRLFFEAVHENAVTSSQFFFIKIYQLFWLRLRAPHLTGLHSPNAGIGILVRVLGMENVLVL